MYACDRSSRHIKIKFQSDFLKLWGQMVLSNDHEKAMLLSSTRFRKDAKLRWRNETARRVKCFYTVWKFDNRDE